MSQTSVDQYPDWNLLAAWVATVESESVSEAARRLDLSQAAVSMRIKLLETKMGIELLDRGTRPARPTAAGLRLYEGSNELLRRGAEVFEGVRNISRAKMLVIRIGCVDSFAASIGPLLFQGMHSATHQIRLWSGITPTLEAQFENRELDVIVSTSIGNSHPSVRRVNLFSEQYVVALPAQYKSEDFGSLTKLGKSLPLIRYTARSSIGRQIDAYLDRTGDSLERTCEFDTTDPLLSLVSAGIGFAITTPMCLWQSRQYAPMLRTIPLSSFRNAAGPYPTMSRSFYLAYREGELGRMPKEIESLIRVAMTRKLSVDMAKAFSLPEEVVCTFLSQQLEYASPAGKPDSSV
jgi:DNA-binding transcriptional LysR family regulator